MKYLPLLVFFFFIGGIGGVSAQVVCNGTSLIETVTVEDATINITDYCDYGCDSYTRTCNPHPFYQNAFLGLAILGVVAVPLAVAKYV